jgi:uncharacterized membrane protein
MSVVPPSDVVLPSRDDPAVEGASELIGGPVGRHALLGTSWWTPIRVMLLLVVLASALGVALDQPCRATGWGDGTTQYTHACYSDIVHLYWGRGIAEGLVPYLDDPSATGDEVVEYPVLTGAAMWVTGLLVPDGGDATSRGIRYFDVNALAITLLAAVTVWATARTAGRRPWDAAMVAVAPGLVLTATINWDLYAVALTSLAMLAWARRHPVAAGMLLGLATAAKFYPALLFGPLLVLSLRTGRWRELGQATLGAVVLWCAANVPIMVSNFDGWARFYRLSRERGGDYGSPWLVLSGLGVDLPVARVNVWGPVVFLSLCIGIGLLGLMARRRPRFAQLAFLVLVAFVLTNKVYSPQYVLWLIPLAVLARPRWRDFLLWQTAEVVYFLSVWWYIHGFTEPDTALPARIYWVAVTIHLVATAAYGALVVRDILRPEYDPVRANGADDPSGGVFDGAADRFVLGDAPAVVGEPEPVASPPPS